MRTKILLLFLQIILFCSCATGKKSNNASVADDLNSLLKTGKTIYFEKQNFESDWEINTALEQIIESDALQRCYVNSAITFKECVFKGKVSAYSVNKNGVSSGTYFNRSVSFINCIFEADVNFRLSVFSAPVTFNGSSFLKPANFEECTFVNEAYYNETKYREEARFQNSVFMKKANWMKSRFEGNVSFQGAVFYNDAQFSSVEFQKYSDFTVATFQMNSFFNYAQFNDQLLFNNSVFYNRMEMLSNKIVKAELRNCTFFAAPKFYQNELSGPIDFSRSVFLTGLPDLSSVKWLRESKCIAEEVKSGDRILSKDEFMTLSKKP